MPKSSPRDAEPVDAPAAATKPAAVESTEPAAAEPVDGEADDSPTYANRAERRARGKGSTQPPPRGKGPQFNGRGSVQGPRNWGTRRSG
jgi:hypothetical protein